MNQNSQGLVNKEHTENPESEKVHNPVHILTIYPELEAIVKAWPDLPEHIKAAIKALIQTHITEKK